MGYDLHRLSATSSPALQIKRALDRFGIDVVFDVGANGGQFGSELFAMGYPGKVISFEPLSSAHRTLVRNACGNSNWITHPRCAIGESDGDASINISSNSVSSSLLPILESHLSAAPESAYGSSEQTPIYRLDSVGPTYLETDSRLFIKIDTQGYESQVLNGAPCMLAAASGVLCELSLVPLYEGQALWGNIMTRLEGLGFSLWSLQQGFVDPTDGRTLQMDGIFFKLQEPAKS